MHVCNHGSWQNNSRKNIFETISKNIYIFLTLQSCSMDSSPILAKNATLTILLATNPQRHISTNLPGIS